MARPRPFENKRSGSSLLSSCGDNLLEALLASHATCRQVETSVVFRDFSRLRIARGGSGLLGRALLPPVVAALKSYPLRSGNFPVTDSPEVSSADRSAMQ